MLEYIEGGDSLEYEDDDAYWEEEEDEQLTEEGINSDIKSGDILGIYFRKAAQFPLLHETVQREALEICEVYRSARLKIMWINSKLNNKKFNEESTKPANIAVPSLNEISQLSDIEKEQYKKIWSKPYYKAINFLKKNDSGSLEDLRKLSLSEREIKSIFQEHQIENFDKLINHNLRLSISIAKRYNGSNLSFVDRIGEANIGLTSGIVHFDLKYNNNFSTFVVNWIKESVRRAVINNEGNIRVPIHVVEHKRRFSRRVDQFEQDHKEKPKYSEKLEFIEGRANLAEVYLSVFERRELSMNMLVGEDEENELGDLIASEAETEKELFPVSSPMIDQLKNIFEEQNISPKARLIFILRNELPLNLFDFSLANVAELVFSFTSKHERREAQLAAKSIEVEKNFNLEMNAIRKKYSIKGEKFKFENDKNFLFRVIEEELRKEEPDFDLGNLKNVLLIVNRIFENSSNNTAKKTAIFATLDYLDRKNFDYSKTTYNQISKIMSLSKTRPKQIYDANISIIKAAFEEYIKKRAEMQEES